MPDRIKFFQQNFLQFLFGAATSSHQVEGNNIHNDWWRWETEGKLKWPSGLACDHFMRFRDDIEMLSRLGHNAHRFSLEWSRLEPQKGKWDEDAWQHYADVIQELRKRQIEPIVTLHHFTSPVWFENEGGWVSDQAHQYFARFAKKAAETYGQSVRLWITINEPLVYLYHGYYAGLWPPGYQSLDASLRAFRQFVYAHLISYQTIHRHYEQIHRPVWVSIAQHMSHFSPCRETSLLDRLATRFRKWFFNHVILDAVVNGFLFFPGLFCEVLPSRDALDFIGVNYYTRDFIRFEPKNELAAIGTLCDKNHHHAQIGELNEMGWEVYAQGLYEILVSLKRFRLPVLITENGICTDDDEQRVRFVRDHLSAVKQAKDNQVPIMGYLYWSLLDNFEWAHGFDPRFGLVEVDYANQMRKVRRSAYVLTESCRKLFIGGQDYATRSI